MVVLAFTVALAFASIAVAQSDATGLDTELERLIDASLVGACVETGASVEIEGVGRAVYDRVEFDGAAGTARLRGSVCIELADGSARLRATSVDLAGLGGDATPSLAATEATLSTGPWHLSVGRIGGPLDALRLNDVIILGPGAVGRASAGEIGIDRIELESLAVATSSYLIEARSARIEGSDLLLTDASGTSCTCRIERYRLWGSEIRSSLDGGASEIHDPVVRLLGVDVPLGDVLTLRPDGRDLEFPIAVEARGDLGTVVVWRGSSEAGVSLEAGSSTGDDAFPLVTLASRSSDAQAQASFDRRGVRIEAHRDRVLQDFGTLQLFTATDLQSGRPRLRNGLDVRTDPWSGRATWSGLDLVGSASANAGIEIAAEPDRSVAGVRVPFTSDAALSVALAEPLALVLSARGEAVGYPGTPGFDGVGQAAATLTARLRYGSDAFEAQTFATRRVAVGATPFSFDALSDRARVGGSAAWKADRFAADLRVEWRLEPETPGAEHLEARLSTTLVDHQGWRASVRAEADVAGAFDGPAKEDWLEVGAAVVHDGGVTLRAAYRWEIEPWSPRSLTLAARYDPVGDGRLALDLVRDLATSTWISIEAGVAWPVEFSTGDVTVRLVPRAAVDVAPWLAGDAAGPAWSKHGATVELIDCCGTLRVGYLYDLDDGLSLDVGLALPPLEFNDLPRTELPSLPALPSTYGGTP